MISVLWASITRICFVIVSRITELYSLWFQVHISSTLVAKPTIISCNKLESNFELVRTTINIPDPHVNMDPKIKLLEDVTSVRDIIRSITDRMDPALIPNINQKPNSILDELGLRSCTQRSESTLEILREFHAEAEKKLNFTIDGKSLESKLSQDLFNVYKQPSEIIFRMFKKQEKTADVHNYNNIHLEDTQNSVEQLNNLIVDNLPGGGTKIENLIIDNLPIGIAENSSSVELLQGGAASTAECRPELGGASDVEAVLKLENEIWCSWASKFDLELKETILKASESHQR